MEEMKEVKKGMCAEFFLKHFKHFAYWEAWIMLMLLLLSTDWRMLIEEECRVSLKNILRIASKYRKSVGVQELNYSL